MTDERVSDELQRNGCKQKLSQKNYEFPSFWKLALSEWKYNDSEDECFRAAIKTTIKLWPAANNDGGKYSHHSKPVIQAQIPCTSLHDSSTKFKCRQLVQFREPISWMESHFNYFCYNCKDNNKYCGAYLDAKCGKKHRQIGDHETITSWARKYGNVFTRTLHPDSKLRKGGVFTGNLTLEGWTYPNLELPRHVDEVLERIKVQKDCVVAMEDPKRLKNIEDCLGDQRGLYSKLGFSANLTVNYHKAEKEELEVGVKAELREILAPDIALYKALFPFLTM